MHVRAGQGTSNNEIVLDTRSLVANLPKMVLAFFYRSKSSHESGEADVRRYRAAFLEAYGLSGRKAPLVHLDLGLATGVFSLAS